MRNDDLPAPAGRRNKVLLVALAVVAALAMFVGGYLARPAISDVVAMVTGTSTTETDPAEVPPGGEPTETVTPVADPSASIPNEEPTVSTPNEECGAMSEAQTDRERADALLCEVNASQEPLGSPPPSDPNVTPPPKNIDPPEVILAGEEWFGTYGVNVCSSSAHEYCGDELHVGGVDYNWYQCVELVQRHYQAMGWHEGIFAGVGGAVDIYDKAESLEMERIAYNEVRQIASGDMIVHNSAGYDSADGGAGHVSVVNFVDGNIVHAVEQNANKNGRAVYIVVDNTLVRVDKRDGEIVTRVNTVKGVVHTPKNTANKPYDLKDGFDEEEFARYLALVEKEGV